MLQSFTISSTNQTVYINPLLVRWVGTYRGATQIHFSDDVNRVLTVSESIGTVERALSDALMALAHLQRAEGVA
jgi:hypothetical protein